jgi:hypothetical protein
MKGIMPDDPWITEMDPVQKMWMFENWLADRGDDAELAKNHAYLVASFDHPETVKQLVGGGNIHESTDEDFEESSRMVRESAKPVRGKKRKKRHLIEG